MDRVEFVGRRRIPLLRTVLYGKWKLGEFSLLGAADAPDGSFESLNMIVYRDGRLGPRHGARNLELTGTNNGVVKGLGWRGTPGADLWWIQGTATSSADSRTLGGPATVWAGALAGTPTATPQWIEFGTQFSYVTIYGDKTYKLDHIAQTVTAVAGSPGGRGIAFYGDRMCIGGTNPDFERVFLSNVNDPDDWTLGEFFNIPNQSGSIMALWTQRNHLTLWAANGEWWVVTGNPADLSIFIRRVSGGGQHPWNASANRGASLPSDDILHVPIALDVPSLFDGSVAKDIPYMAINNQNAPDNETEVKVLRGMRADEGVIVFPAQSRFAVFYNDQWTFHEFDPAQIPVITEFFASDEQGQILFTDGGGVGTPPKFYTWTMNAVEHPGFDQDLSKPGDDSTQYFNAWVNFPEYWVPEGYEVRVRRVIIDFTEWDTGANVPNGFTIIPRTLSRLDDPGTSDAASQQYSNFPSGAWDTGIGASQRLRQVFRYGTDARYGGGFQIRVSGIGGVAFQSIRVDAQIRYDVPRE